MGEATLRKHALVQWRAENAPLVQTFEPPGSWPFAVNLTFLSSRPALARVLANSFWMIHQPRPRNATARRIIGTLRQFHRFLSYRCQSQPDVLTAKDLSTDLLKEFAVWLMARRGLKTEVGLHFSRPAAVSCASHDGCTPKSSLRSSPPRETYLRDQIMIAPSQRPFHGPTSGLLAEAGASIRKIPETYQPGNVPTSAQQLIPFMVIIAARTGINAEALYGLDRNCLSPHEFEDNLFYCTWDKPRARKQQKQLHRADHRNQMGVVELIQFLRQFTEPLAPAAGPPECTKLFLYFGRSPHHIKSRLVSPGTRGAWVPRHLREFVDRHGLPQCTLASIRPTAATQLYLETGGNLRKVQQFLQHRELQTTVKYLLNSITERFNARVIQRAQERMIERVTVIPEKRAQGVERLDLQKTRALKIVAGQFDTGCGTCRDPYDSPQPGEEKGRACTSFHACFSCPNGLWFLED